MFELVVIDFNEQEKLIDVFGSEGEAVRNLNDFIVGFQFVTKFECHRFGSGVLFYDNIGNTRAKALVRSV